jgi:hypothetical protein
MLTCHAACGFAAKEQPSKFERLEKQLILGFTPKLTDDPSWSAVIMNYYFCLGMVKLNPAVAVCLMEEAGVLGDSIELALTKNQQISVSRTEFKIEDTRTALAPPTFSGDPSLWLERGYEVQSDLKPGDVCVFERSVGFYQRSTDTGLYIVTGFYVGSVGSGISEDILTKVIRV